MENENKTEGIEVPAEETTTTEATVESPVVEEAVTENQ